MEMQNGRFLTQRITSAWGMWILLVGFMILGTVLSPVFLTHINIANILRQASIFIILATAESLVLISGNIDLSLGSVVAFSSVAFALTAAYGIPQALLITLVGTTLMGLTGGFLVTYGRIPPFIATLGTMGIARSLAMTLANGQPVYGVPASYAVVGEGFLGPVPIPAVIAAAIFLMGLFLLTQTAFGRHVYAIGGEEEVARLSGVNVRLTKLLVYVLCGLFTGIAGLIYTGRITVGMPEGGVGYEMDAIASCVIGGIHIFGGRGSLWGTLVGALILTLISNIMNLLGISPYLQYAVKGAVILLAVLLWSRGMQKGYRR